MTPPSAAPSRRTSRKGRAAQPVPRGGSTRPPKGSARLPGDAASPAGRSARSSIGQSRVHPPVKAPVELRPLRIAALVLLLVAAAFYVSPLRAFFAQQDRYDRQVTALAQARVQNQTLHAQIARMRTRDYVTRQAREQYQLVPPGLQAFVVKGLPDPEPSASPSSPAVAGPSLVSRLADLWRTIRQ